MMIVAVVAAYNEEKRIAAAIADASRFVNAVVVTDDGSVDDTVEVARRSGAHVLRHALNRGQGAALQTATDYALRELRADIIVHFDADGQLLGEEIPLMIEPILNGQADVVLGSRFLGTTQKMPFTRRLAVRGGILFTILISGIRVTDTHNGFRALSRHAAQNISITLDRFAHASQILDLIKANHLRYVECPVTIRYSAETLAKGASSLRMFGVVKDLLKEIFLGEI